MRIALVSPYSWTYPGGVTRHIEALAEQLLAEGPHVRVLAPFDPPDRRQRAAASRCPPAGARAARLRHPARAHGRHSRQRRGLEPRAHAERRADAAPRARGRRLRRRPHPRAGRARRRAGTRSASATRAARRHLPHYGDERRHPRHRARDGRAAGACATLHGRIAVSEAAAWTGAPLLRRPLRIIPNGVDVPGRARRRAQPAAAGARCGSRSSARPSSARACRSCCAPSRRCASTSPPS